MQKRVCQIKKNILPTFNCYCTVKANAEKQQNSTLAYKKWEIHQVICRHT